MNQAQPHVEPLWIDRANERVHRGESPLRLTPKAFAVLRHLMDRSHLLATKEELLAAVWPGTAVTEASLSTCIREIRRTLDDDPATPLYVQTVHRRGFRYIGPTLNGTRTPDATRTNAPVDARVVGRERELASLDRALRQVAGGAWSLVLVAGEAGIGKTTLVEAFIERMAGQTSTRIARGQCVEQYGACEAYLPWFDVLNHLSRDYGPERLTAVLRQYAPLWLAQLPWLIDAADRQHLQREIIGATRERMIRELAQALAAMSAERPLVVLLEDLHWSDPSSIGLLAYLARGLRPPRLLLLGTYRPQELHDTSHPLTLLKHELLLHGACEHLSLDFLTREAVADYVRSRLPDAPEALAIEIHRRTDGNPLFMVNVVDYLIARDSAINGGETRRLNGSVQAAETEVPESLKEMIERQIDRLPHEERLVLEAASVVGAAFSAATVAAVLERSVESTEERLSAMARRGSFVRPSELETWPDGTESDGYAFIHVLYQNVLYERMGTSRRSSMHRRAGERLEAGYGDRTQEIAAELALHFQRGRDERRAVGYLAQAGESAIRRGAYVEAIALLNQGIGLLSTLPEGADRDTREIELRVPLGVCYINTRGYAAPEVGITFHRAHGLCRHVNDTSHLFRVLRGLWSFLTHRADLEKAQSMAKELLDVAEREADASGLLEGHRILATTWFHVGNFSQAFDHLQRGLALYDTERHSSHAFLYGHEPGVSCYAWQAWTQWHRGYPDQAVESAGRGIELARQIGHPFSTAYALNFAAHVHILRGDAVTAERHASEALRCAREHGLKLMLAIGQVMHGWSHTFVGRHDEGICELKEGVARWQSTGAVLATPYWLHMLASALDRAGRHAEASEALDHAFAHFEHTDERWFECQLHILKAALNARAHHSNGHGPGDRRGEPESHLRRALQVAIDLDSPSLRLRAANALGRVMRDQGRTDEAKDLVSRAYAAFSEGFQTADLTEARALLRSW